MTASTRPKFLVLSNGLRDQLGHYFETSLSVAEAAERAGFRSILGTHVECRGGLLPDWLAGHALFRTDHWMWDGPSVSNEPKAGRRSALKIVRRGLRLAERGAYFLLPPLFYDAARLVAYCCLPRIAAPASRARALAGLRSAGLRLRYGQDAALVEQASQWPELRRALAERPAPPRVVEAARRLLPEGVGRELEHSLVFLQDLRQFLSATSVGPNDHVLLQTAHAREALAVHLAVESLGAQAPTFHLEFRHPLFEHDMRTGEPIETPNTRLQRSFLQLHVDWGTSDRVRFYTDSKTLSEDYASLVDLPFGVLPLPFRAELMPKVARPSTAPVTMVYLGGARDEKGFHWLPDLIESLADDYLAPGRARLLIQTSLGQPEHNPRSVAALRRLRQRPGVELVGKAGALAPAEYYQLAAQADIMLLPYLRDRYRACTSGVLAEALAAGAAAVVPAGTWLAEQLPPGGGETFDGDVETFVAATKRVLDHFPAYRAAAQAHRAAWLSHHSPDALVGALVGERANGALAGRRAA
ncbi:MAG TPA: glycosyltransferase [Pirellulales bacterium]|nr:glycosyltransferase [Pirellulales bacterium]